MKRLCIRTALAAVAFAAALGAFAPAPASAQTTSVRAPAAVNGVSMGIVCDTASGWVLTTSAAGVPQCTQNVANATNATTATNATNAQNAVTATTATTAVQAQTLNPSATVNASQISGVIAASNLPAGSGSGGTTCVGGNITVSGRPGTVGWNYNQVPGSYYYADSGVTGSFSAAVPSLGAGQTTTLSVTGQASGANYGASGSGSAKVTCNTDGTYSWSNVSLSGCQVGNAQSGNYICMTEN